MDPFGVLASPPVGTVWTVDWTSLLLVAPMKFDGTPPGNSVAAKVVLAVKVMAELPLGPVVHT
jgi:hypothetical protein